MVPLPGSLPPALCLCEEIFFNLLIHLSLCFGLHLVLPSVVVWFVFHFCCHFSINKFITHSLLYSVRQFSFLSVTFFSIYFHSLLTFCLVRLSFLYSVISHLVFFYFPSLRTSISCLTVSLSAACLALPQYLSNMTLYSIKLG